MTYPLPQPLDVHASRRSFIESTRSLHTASSATLFAGISNGFPRHSIGHATKSRGALGSLRLRQQTFRAQSRVLQEIQTILDTAGSAEDIPDETYEDLVEFQRPEFYSDEVRARSWNILLSEMSKQRVQGLVRVLCRLPMDQMKYIFGLLVVAERTHGWSVCPVTGGRRHWRGSQGNEWRVLNYHASRSLSYMLISVTCDRQELLDDPQITTDTYQQVLPTLHLLLHLFSRRYEERLHDYPPHNMDVFIRHVISKYPAPLNVPDTLSQLMADYTRFHGAAIFFDRGPPELMSDLVDRLLNELHTPPTDMYSPVRLLPNAPALLWFATHLAYESASAARLLAKRGLLRCVESIYDNHDLAATTSCHDYAILLRLCWLLLAAASRHQDLSPYTLKDEIAEDLRQRSREFSERWFGVFWVD